MHLGIMPRSLPSRLLLVDDSKTTLELISDRLRQEGFWVDCALSAVEAFAKASRSSYDIVMTDLVMPELDGMEVLAHFAERYPDTVVILLTGHATIETAVEAMRRGAFDYLTKPTKLDEISLVLKRAQEYISLKAENVFLKSQLQDLHRFERIIGKSRPMQTLYKIIQRVAKTDSTILILGESGTGKELIANAIHANSARKDKPFVPINCGAIPEELMESELFGHEKGAFTGALKERKGRFELANWGTVFLDEIGDMSPKLQVKLLRFLQERRFERVGSSRTVEVDVRVIAATNKDLEQEVANSNFREDLFYRLNVIPIHVPPLRERGSDIPLLVQHFLKQHCQKKVIPQKNMSNTALEVLQCYEWPGNVRELENVMERLVILVDGDQIQVDDLPARMRRHDPGNSQPLMEISDEGIDLKQILDDLENHLIMEALKKSGGVKNKAAALLGLNRTTLIEKMKKKKINYPLADS
jgi:DNA-binding NtrC family response regulator